jgi:two-component system, chemotaxis family, sensor kinase CheA
MSVDLNDEIVQDFLVEAGEILEQLGGQLVDLEQRPEDRDLLNSVFRGFHTIKGGAGFIGLDALVEISHKAEDIFDLLRKGARKLDAALMDVFLQVLDELNGMFDALRAGEDPARAPASLLAALATIAQNKPLPTPAAVQAPAPTVAPVAVPVQAPAPTPAPVPAAATPKPVLEAAAVTSDSVGSDPETPAGGVDITEAEFDALLNELDAQKKATPTAPALAQSADNDNITEAEFDAMLENRQGQKSAPETAVTATAAEVANAADTSADDSITESEFDALLDQLHRQPGASTSSPVAPGIETTAADDNITEAEFDAMLNQLHGQQGTSTPIANPAAPSVETTPANGHITETEFDALLNDLHGQGKAPVAAVAVVPQVAAPVEAVVHEPAPAAARSTTAESAPAAPKPQAKAAAAATPQAESTVRVETSVLDRIMNMVGELVLIRNRISTLEAAIGDEEFTKTASILDVVTSDLQAAVMKTRMQPVKKVFGRFPRVVRDLARSLEKEVNLEMYGEETDLDKNLVEALADPLVHLVRNAVDHGIEIPAKRLAAGKPAAGTLTLSAAQEGDHILLTIADDGAGMDPEVLRGKAVEKGLMDEDQAARLDEASCYELIFAAGFSTKSEISDISGRGVGMDVVKTRINQLNGTIQIQSRLGKGTSIIVKLPLTLAIVPTLMVVLGPQIFALPLVNVNEIIAFDKARTNVVDGREVMVVRGRALPLFHLSQWLISGMQAGDGAKGHIVIVSIGTARFGLVVDQLIGQEEVVIKPLGAMLQGTKGLAGATITGDGRIALILDLPGLINSYAHIR